MTDSKSKKANPKRIIIDYIDKLVNFVDIYVEEQLQKCSNKSVLVEIEELAKKSAKEGRDQEQESNVSLSTKQLNNYDIDQFDFDNEVDVVIRFTSEFSSGSKISTAEYLNKTRDIIINQLGQAQKEALSQLETFKSEIMSECKDESEKSERVMNKAFANRFPFLIRIEKSKLINWNDTCPHSLYLIETDFYMNESCLLLLGFLLSSEISNGFVVYGLKNLKISNQKTWTTLEYFDKKVLRVYMLSEYLKGFFGKLNSRFCHVLRVSQRDDLSSFECLRINGFYSFKNINIANDDETDCQVDTTQSTLKNIRSISFDTTVSEVSNLNGLENLEYVALRGLQVCNESLRGLHRLKRLDLGFLCYLTLDIFRSVPQLQFLLLDTPISKANLDFNPLFNLQQLSAVDCLSDLSSLEPACLNKLRMTHIKTDSLDKFMQSIQRFRNLESLELQVLMEPFEKKRLVDLFDINWLCGLESLKSLILASLGFERLHLTCNPETKFPNLDSLDLSGNNLRWMPRMLFTNLTTLKSLSFVSCKIESLEDYVFADLVQLEFLSLNRNNLTSVQVTRNKFAGLDKLKHLDLGKNSLESIGDNTFESLKDLEGLYLGKNKLARVQKSMFNGLFKLKRLHLEKNQIRIVDEEAFCQLMSLEELSLNNNKLTMLDQKVFKGLVSLIKLDLDRNLFINVDILQMKNICNP